MGDAPALAGRRVPAAAAILMLAFAASRLTGLARGIAVGFAFGTSPELDAYLAANRVADLIYQIAIGGAVGAAFIPVFSTYLTANDRAGAWRLLSTLMTISVIALAPICLVIGILAEDVMRVAGGFDDDQRRLAAELLRPQLLSPIFFAIGTFATSALNTRGAFLVPSLAPSLYNLGIIFGALALAPFIGIRGLAIGAAIGALLYAGIQIPSLRVFGPIGRPVLDLTHAGVRQVGRLMAPRVLGLAVSQINFVVIIILASPLPGAIAALDYAWLLMMLPLGLFAMAIANALFPSIAEQAARAEWSAVGASVRSALSAVLYLVLPAALGLALLAEPIVATLLERGAFVEGSARLTATALRFYALGLVGQSIVEIVARGFYARQDTRRPVIVATLAVAVNVALAFPLREALGHGGLALALSLSSVAEAIGLIVLARHRMPGVVSGKLVASLARVLVGIIAMGGMAALLPGAIAWHGHADSEIDRIARLLILVAGGGATYLVATILARAREPIWLAHRLRARMR